MSAKIHPWPTRCHPETGRYEVLIAERWVSRQRAWALLRRMDGRCPQCGADVDMPGLCRRCARKHSRSSDGQWTGPWKPGKRGRARKLADAYTQTLA